jgi:hypothetical protein
MPGGTLTYRPYAFGSFGGCRSVLQWAKLSSYTRVAICNRMRRPQGETSRRLPGYALLLPSVSNSAVI